MPILPLTAKLPQYQRLERVNALLGEIDFVYLFSGSFFLFLFSFLFCPFFFSFFFFFLMLLSFTCILRIYL